jgi:uncharacterized protein (TIRG00374 family)
VRPTWRALRAVVAIALTAAALWQADVRAIVDTARGTRPAPLLLALVFVVIDRALMCWRWIALLDAGGVRHVPRAGAVRVFFVSTFLGTFLPQSVGADAVRTVATARLGVPAAAAAASVVLDRLLGVIGIVVLAAAGLFVARELTTSPAIVAALALTLAIAVAGVALISSDRIADLVRGVIGVLPGERLRRFSTEVVSAVQAYRGAHGALAAVLAGSIAVQVLRVLEAWALGLALAIPSGVGVYFAFVPLILLVMLLPITINGIGTSQAAFVWLFGIAGVTPAAAFALSILFLALGVAGNLPGALLYAAGPARKSGTDVRGRA